MVILTYLVGKDGTFKRRINRQVSKSNLPAVRVGFYRLQEDHRAGLMYILRGKQQKLIARF